MSQARVRTTATAGVLIAATLIAVALTFATTKSTAQAADALQAGRTLFTAERFTPTSIPDAKAGAVLPEAMVAVRGETEGFQFAINNGTGAALSLEARVVGDGGAFSTPQLAPSFSRVGMVNVPVGSSGYGTSPGLYADPLPPIVPGKAAGQLQIAPGQWGGILFQVRVRTDAAAGRYAGTLELFSPGSQVASETVYGRQPFTLDVANASGGALLQPSQPGAFITTLGVEGEQYWLGHKGMRNGKAEGYAARPQRGAQLQGLFAFLDERGFSPLETSLAVPNASGSYAGCAYDSTKGEQPAVSALTQLTQRVFNMPRAGEPGATSFQARWMPFRTEGCVPESTHDEFKAVSDPKRTPSLKQDDWMDTKAPAFWSKVASEWRANSLFSARTYVKSPFDEPSDATPNQRIQMDRELPKSTTALHKAVGKSAKVVLAGWPRDERKQKVCKKKKPSQKKPQCAIFELDTFGNRKQWDGKGADDIDVWMVPLSRMYGRITQPHLKQYKVDRSLEYSKRLAGIRAKKKGSETWAYTFYTGDKRAPQTVIDAPGTDPVLQYWLSAQQGHTGLFVSNLLMGWATDNPGNHTDKFASVPKKGNPYDTALYFRHFSHYGVAAGWGTFIYPPFAPQLGLDSEDQRNTGNGRPVSSLRIEGMRDGQEDANLLIMYKNRFGQAALDAKMKAITPGKFHPQVRSLGQVVFPDYDNANLAQRLETVRREMIAQLAA